MDVLARSELRRSDDDDAPDTVGTTPSEDARTILVNQVSLARSLLASPPHWCSRSFLTCLESGLEPPRSIPPRATIQAQPASRLAPGYGGLRQV